MLDTNGRSRDFSHLDKLSTDELKELLRQDSMLDENEDSDIDAVLYIMEVLARRENEKAAAQDTESAWQSFKDNYYPYTSDPEPLFSFDGPGRDEAPAPSERKNRFFKRLVKPLSIAAIVIFVLLTGTITSYALGFDLWGAFAAWTHETFGFISSTKATDSQPFPNLRTALDMYGIDADSIVPNWLPEDFGEDIVQVSESPSGNYIVSRCIGNNREISMEVNVYADLSPVYRTYEKQNDSTEIYVSYDMEYYITRNGGANRITWTTSNLECSIFGDLEINETYKIIDSIQEG